MKCMIQERNEIILDEEYMIWVEDQVGNVKRLSVKCLGERKRIFCREKMERNENKNTMRLYIENHKTRWIKRYRELSSTNSR